LYENGSQERIRQKILTIFNFSFLVNDLGEIGMRVEAKKELAVGCQIAPSQNITQEFVNRRTVAQEIVLYRKIVNLGG
jgi:hypothetical protein